MPGSPRKRSTTSQAEPLGVAAENQRRTTAAFRVPQHVAARAADVLDLGFGTIVGTALLLLGSWLTGRAAPPLGDGVTVALLYTGSSLVFLASLQIYDPRRRIGEPREPLSTVAPLTFAAILSIAVATGLGVAPSSLLLVPIWLLCDASLPIGRSLARKPGSQGHGASSLKNGPQASTALGPQPDRRASAAVRTGWPQPSAGGHQVASSHGPSLSSVGVQTGPPAGVTPLEGLNLMSLVSHELRCPLASLSMSAELALAEDMNEEERRRMLHVIHRQAGRLAALLEDVLQAAQLGSGSVLLRPTPAALGELVREQVVEFAELHNDHAFRVDVGEGLPPAWVDPAKVAIVIRNLLYNAAKYSPGGSPIHVEVRSNGANHLAVRVSDQGPGIPARYRDKVFEQFFRLRDREGRQERGQGLGLYIARALVEAQGGRIWVESQVDGGSRFIFTLPVASSGSCSGFSHEGDGPSSQEAAITRRPRPSVSHNNESSL